MTDPRVDQIAGLLRLTGAAHHRAFIETDGLDPEWPMWYAAHLHAELGEILGHEFTESDLVYHLVAAQRRFEAEQRDVDWPEAYARYFLSTRL